MNLIHYTQIFKNIFAITFLQFLQKCTEYKYSKSLLIHHPKGNDICDELFDIRYKW